MTNILTNLGEVFSELSFNDTNLKILAPFLIVVGTDIVVGVIAQFTPWFLYEGGF